MPEQGKIDFKKLKAEIPIDRVLEHYGVASRRVNTIYLRADCPLPSHTSKESKGSFTVNTEKNLWCCKSDSCVANSHVKGGDVLDFVKLMEGLKTALDAGRKLTHWFPNGSSNGSGAKAEPSPSPAQPSPVAGENKPLAFELKGISYCDYLKDRGITEETTTKFGVGYFPGKGSMAGRVVIPIRNEKGELVAYAGRSLNGEEPRYKVPEGFLKSLVLYNLHRIGDQVETVILVEGFFPAIWLDQCGFPNVVSLMGKTLSEEQERLLTFPEIVLMLDGNEAGRQATVEILPRLTRNHFVAAITLQPDQQPDSLTPAELKELLGRFV